MPNYKLLSTVASSWQNTFKLLIFLKSIFNFHELEDRNWIYQFEPPESNLFSID